MSWIYIGGRLVLEVKAQPPSRGNCFNLACNWLPPGIIVTDAQMSAESKTGFQASQEVEPWLLTYLDEGPGTLTQGVYYAYSMAQVKRSIRVNLCNNHTKELLEYFPIYAQDTGEIMSNLYLEDRTFL